MFKSIDKRLEEIGFIKVEEGVHGVYYQRNIGEYRYVQNLDIIHKESGRHLIMSYQDGVNSDNLNNVVGLTYKETKLALKKFRQMKRKYEWS